jgi:proteasome component ECM29
MSMSDAKSDKNLQTEIANVLIQILNESPESKVREYAAISLGYLSLGSGDETLRSVVSKGLMSVSKCRQLEVQFSVGESLSCTAAGWASKSAIDPLIPSLFHNAEGETSDRDDSFSGNENDKIMMSIITEIFDLLGNSMSAVRTAALVWLLCLVKYAGRHPLILKCSHSIQDAFCELLSDSDDLVQEVAGRGLVFLQQISVGEERNRLLSALTQRLSGSSRPQRSHTIADDAPLLPLPQSNMTTNSSSMKGTYRELCTLANEAGQPDLIYSLMAITSQHAVWNSRRGAAFAVGEIIAQG